jgi:hypothetical protein
MADLTDLFGQAVIQRRADDAAEIADGRSAAGGALARSHA